MSATAPRIAQANPDMRPLGVALGSLVLAVALLVTAAVARLDTAASAEAAPAAALHDHGWIESTYVSGPDLTINGFDKAHAVNVAQSRDLIVETESGGINYTGIPYPAPGDASTGGSNGTRFAQ